MDWTRRWIVLPAVLALACASPAPPPPPELSGGGDVIVTNTNAKLVGVGSRALTEHVGATYFIRSADPKTDMVLEFVVFLKGTPGWTNQKTHWKFSTGEPAFSRYVIFDKEFRVDLDLGTATGKVLDRSIPLSTANIVVVDGFGGPTLTVTYSEHQDLRVPSITDPMREILLRSPALQKALALFLLA